MVAVAAVVMTTTTHLLHADGRLRLWQVQHEAIDKSLGEWAAMRGVAIFCVGAMAQFRKRFPRVRLMAAEVVTSFPYV